MFCLIKLGGFVYEGDKEKVNILPNTSLYWYKQKFKTYPDVKIIVDLIGWNKVGVEFIPPRKVE